MVLQNLRLVSLICLLVHYIQAVYDCSSVKNCDCAEKPSRAYELDCPNNNSLLNNAIHIIIEKDRFSLNCGGTANYMNYIPALEPVDNTYFFEVVECAIPETGTISDVMIRLGAKNPEIFRIISSNITNITRANFKELTLVKKLYLTSNRLTVLPSDLLYDMEDLIYIEISNHEELVLPEELFSKTRNISNIDIGQNNLKNLPSKLFANLSHLTTLNLWSNKLTHIDSDMFEGLTKLKVLELFVNEIRTLSAGIFDHLPELEELSIRKNFLEILPEGLFRKNLKLKILKLDDNPHLKFLPDNFLSNLPNLTDVSISACNLQHIPENTFWGSPNLHTLILSRNNLSALQRDVFKHADKLEALTLQSNALETLEDGIFRKVKNLKTLRLGSNKLNITPYTFDGLGNLKELYIPYNNLHILQYKSFLHFQKLRIIDMSHNRLTLTDPLFAMNERMSIFSHMKHLEKIYLDNNNITDIFWDWRINLSNLTELNLSYNDIQYLRYTDFNFVTNKDVLIFLDHNQIETIDMKEAEIISRQNHQLNRNSNDKRITRVFLNDNPLDCDCRIYDLVRYFQQIMDPVVRNNLELIADGLVCAAPDTYKGDDPTNLRPQTLTCVITDGPKMPDDCSSEPLKYRTADNMFIVNCSNNQLTVPPNLSDIGKYKNIELHLEGNNLTRLPGANMGYEKVVRLDLSNNRISGIDWLPPNISELYLHNNNLTNLSPNELFLLNRTSLTNVTLYNNPWICNCDIVNFTKYLQENFKRVLYLSNITCGDDDNNGRQLTDMTTSELCPLPRELIISLSVLLAVCGLMFGIALALYFRYQQEIKVWLYAHNLCLYCVHEEELDKDKLYDAFISYSHQDEDFVVNELLPKLECEPTPFKLCLHFRNFQPGEFITTNIAKSVADSRRTLVVLSPNFLKSEWGKMEFRTAHIQALSDGRARVIVVIYGDLGPVNDLDAELKAYLTTNTYVKWGDPWFWDKLRYALPHRSKYAKSVVVTQPLHKIKIFDDKIDLIHEPVTPPIGTTPPADAVHLDPLLKSEKTMPDALNVALINGTLFNGARNKHFINNNMYNSDIRSIV